jgi:hypothetical protein
MTDDRAPFREARLAGKAIHQQQRLDRADLAIVKAAIEHLPATCRYHEDRLDRESRWGGGACCDTGKPALARREAEAALERLTP